MTDQERSGKTESEGASPDPARISERDPGIRETTYKLPATRESAKATEATQEYRSPDGHDEAIRSRAHHC
jgi:hypothetical protein